MRRLLLDTHTALWALTAPDTLTPSVRDAITDPRNDVYVSAVTVWEVEIKRAIGKLRAPAGFANECVVRGFDPLPIDLTHAELAGTLPLHHNDPFDRMLVAQAISEQLEVVSDDRAFHAYGVNVVQASRKS